MHRLILTQSVRWIGLSAWLLFAVVLPASAQTHPVAKVLTDIPYKQGEGISDLEKQRCRLDLYLPDAKGFPTVVWFYGGGLEIGQKNGKLHSQLARTLAEHGVACVTPDYRLSPATTYPGYVDDAAASIAWTLKHIADYGGDRSRVFVSGHSAGGYLASEAAYNARHLAVYGLSTGEIAGIVPFSPQVFTHFTIRKERGMPDPRFTPVIDDAAPAQHARPDAPATLILVGDNDMPTRVEECAYFVALLRAVKHPDAAMKVIAGRNHGSILKKATEPGDPAMEAMLEFIRCHPRPATAPATMPGR